MGKLDIGISDWLKDKERFADLFNGLLFDGEPVVKKDELDGPLQLYDMFDMPLNTRASDVLKRYVPDYRINLIELEKIDYKKFTTDLQIMFGMLKYRKDKVLLARYIEENRSYFADVDEDTLEAGVALLGFKGVIVDRLQ